jgi:ribonuclease P protein component
VNRRHRLHGRRAFAAVRERRLAAAAGALRVQVAPNRVGVARVGMVVPRAVGGAVVRNRVRRRLRALLVPELLACAGLDVVVVASPAAADRPSVELAADLAAGLAGALARLRGGPRDGRASPPPGGDGAAAPALRDNRVSATRPARAHPAGDRPASP